MYKACQDIKETIIPDEFLDVARANALNVHVVTKRVLAHAYSSYFSGYSFSPTVLCKVEQTPIN